MTPQVRVLLLTPHYPPARGAIQYLLHGIVRHATQVAFRVVALGDGPATAFEKGVLTRRLTLRGPRAGVLSALAVASLAEARRWQPDVVLCGHIVMAPAARLIGRPVVQYLYASEMTSRPRLTAYAARHAAASIVLGAHGRSLALSAGVGEHRIHVIPPGIDLPTPPVTTPHERAPSIVHAAGLNHRHSGSEVLVRALPLIRSRVPDATLTLVGNGHLRPSLEALARASGGENALICVGRIADAERDALFATATVFALPSRLGADSGGHCFGMVYLEAGAQGTPVVAGTDSDALDRVIDGDTGVLVDPEDHIEVAEAITGLLLDRERATRLGAGGRRRAELYDWNTVVREVEKLLLMASLSVE